jgi:hypothetical protein
MDDALLAEHVDAVHAVAREDFVRERDARVRALKQDGHTEEAAALKGLRKPTVAAWAVNQLARREPDRVGELVAAGDALRAAQRRAASGQGADGLRPATRRVRDLVGDLGNPARTVLADAGAAVGHADEVEQTLFAAAIDPELHDTLRRGIFTGTVEAAGFGTLAGLVPVPPASPKDDAEATPDATGSEETESTERRRREEEQRAVRAAHRAALERQRADLQRSLVRQQRRVDHARQQADDLQARADQAAVKARDEQEGLDVIEDEMQTVEAELDALPQD